jgi:DNA polymerase-3 subunit delta
MLKVVIGDQSREMKVEALIKEIKEKNPGIEEKIFDALQGEDELFLSQSSTNSIFGGKELLFLKRAENVKKLEELFKALKNFDLSNKEIVISIECDEKGLSKKVTELIKSYGEIYETLEAKKNPKEMIEYIITELKVDNKTALNLFEMIGNNVNKLKNEIEKLKNYFIDKEFSISEARKLISVNVEYNLFEQVDKLLKGNKKDVLDYLKTEKNSQLFLFWLGQELKELLKLSLLVKEGKLVKTNNYNVFKNKFDENTRYFVGKHPYRVFKTMENLNNFDDRKLKALLKELLETEYKIKSGYGEEAILIDLLVLKI